MKLNGKAIERIANDYNLTMETVKSIMHFVNVYGSVTSKEFIDVVEEICMLALEERVKVNTNPSLRPLTTEEIALKVLGNTPTTKPSKLCGYDEDDEPLGERVINEPLYDESEFASSIEDLLTEDYEGIRSLPDGEIPYESSYLEPKNHRR